MAVAPALTGDEQIAGPSEAKYRLDATAERTHQVLELIASLLGVDANPTFTASRPGDVRQSCADISAARAALGFDPTVGFEDGMARTVEWFRSHR